MTIFCTLQPKYTKSDHIREHVCSSSEDPPELESERSFNSSAKVLYLEKWITQWMAKKVLIVYGLFSRLLKTHTPCPSLEIVRTSRHFSVLFSATLQSVEHQVGHRNVKWLTLYICCLWTDMTEILFPGTFFKMFVHAKFQLSIIFTFRVIMF